MTLTRRLAVLGSGVGATALTLLAATRPGPALVAVAAIVLVAVPTARHLSGRLFTTSVLVAGGLVLLGWLPVAGPGVVALGLALTAGLVTGWAVAREDRPRLLVPQVRPVDLVPVGAGLVTTAVVSSWLRLTDGATVVATLLGGYDNSAHVAMVLTKRIAGLPTDLLAAAPGGETWKFADYPQGYHAIVAAIMETLAGPTPGPVAAELVTLLRAQSLVLVAVAVALAAGLAALPALRDRPLIVLPLATTTVVAFVLGTGREAVLHGFANFLLAAAAAGAVAMAVAERDRVLDPRRLATVGALLVVVAHTWIPMLAVALPMALALVLPPRRSDWRAPRRDLVLSLAVVALTALAGLRAAFVLMSLSAGAVFVIPGAFVALARPLEFGMILLALAVALALPRPGQWLALGPGVGFLAVLVLGGYQWSASGALSYYFDKLLLGARLASLVVLAVAIGLHLARVRADRRAPVTGLAAALAASLGIGLFLGNPPLPDPRYPVTRPPGPAVESLVVAADAAARHPDRVTVLLDPVLGGPIPLQAQQWHLALTGRWTVEANDRATAALWGVPTDSITQLARNVLADPAALVLVPPTLEAEVRAGLGAEEAERVISW